MSIFPVYLTSSWLRANARRIIITGLILALGLYFLIGFKSGGARDHSSAMYVPVESVASANVILFWTDYFDMDILPAMAFNLSECPVRNCLLTSDRSRLTASAAVVFHGDNLDADDLPPSRDINQLFIFFSLESPFHAGIPNLERHPWPGFFNLTWTYREDSDIFSPYYTSQFHPSQWADRVSAPRTVRRKAAALTMISHCGATSNRDTYIADLQRYFPVDLSGKCGDGLERNIDDYLFYLSFENAFCRDYVTEKAFIPYAHGTVPVVLGMGNYSALLPAHSYIDVADFASPKELGERLRFLSEHPEEYRKYFAWADSEEPYHRPERYRKGRSDICKLCEMVSGHASGLHRRQSSYADLNEWWVTRAKCFSPMNSRRTLVDPLLRVVANLCSFRILKTLLLC